MLLRDKNDFDNFKKRLIKNYEAKRMVKEIINEEIVESFFT